VIRTLDLGGDKLSHILHHTPEMNPFLGWRAIRLTLANEGLFKAQLRAILRASTGGNVRIMFPMISGMQELLDARSVLDGAKAELEAEGVPFDADIPVGAMIEVPSAAVVADQLAEEVDFISIGTNDLIQYTIAVDRGNERVAYLFDPFHPAVLRLIKTVADAGRAHNIPVTLCGEMAGDPWACVLLLGLGVGGFSTSPRAVPEVKRAIRAVSLSEARQLAEQVLAQRTSEQIRACLKECLPEGIREAFGEAELLNGEPGSGLNGGVDVEEPA
jgi:phosphotransferase system enzyme I (PtsI)